MIPPDIVGKIAEYLPRSKNVRKFRSSFSPAYGFDEYIRVRRPPRTTSTGIYRAVRSVRSKGYSPPDSKKARGLKLDKLLPTAYKNSTWKYYTTVPRLLFLDDMRTNNFYKMDRRGKKTRVTLEPEQIRQIKRKTLRSRKSTDTWSEYTKRAKNYVRYIKGEPSRQRILNEVKNYINGGRPFNWYLYRSTNGPDVERWIRTGILEKRKNVNAGEGHGNYRLSDKALLFYLSEVHGNDYKKVPGFGITRRNNPKKMTRKNIENNLKSMYDYV
jgi:hypothetical protein